jgi:hypothetical protein
MTTTRTTTAAMTPRTIFFFFELSPSEHEPRIVYFLTDNGFIGSPASPAGGSP